jgi:large subunit ribosomal protein L23
MNNILKRAVLSEKTNMLKESENKYCFVVDISASKVQVRTAVEKAFEVEVTKVAMLIRRGKNHRRGMYVGRSKNIKRAIVSVKKDQKIKIFNEA